MANFKFFADAAELTNVAYRGDKFLTGVHPLNPPTFDKALGWIGYVKVERKIQYKSNPSKHECDARCMNATGRSMQCECSCGGKNHGKGSFKCE